MPKSARPVGEWAKLAVVETTRYNAWSPPKAPYNCRICRTCSGNEPGMPQGQWCKCEEPRWYDRLVYGPGTDQAGATGGRPTLNKRQRESRMPDVERSLKAGCSAPDRRAGTCCVLRAGGGALLLGFSPRSGHGCPPLSRGELSLGSRTLRNPSPFHLKARGGFTIPYRRFSHARHPTSHARAMAPIWVPEAWRGPAKRRIALDAERRFAPPNIEARPSASGARGRSYTRGSEVGTRRGPSL